MRLTNTIKKSGMLVLGLLLISAAGHCATFEAVATGNWSSTTTWGGTAPSYSNTGDQIIIASGVTVTMDGDVTLNGTSTSLDVEGNLAGASGYTLNVASGTLSGAGNVGTGTIKFGSGAIVSFTGTVTADNFTSSALSLGTSANIVANQTLTLSSGVLTILTGGSVSLANNGTLIMAGGSLTSTGGNLLFATSYNVEYNAGNTVTGAELSGSGVQSMIVNVAGNETVTLGSDLNVKGTLTLTSGILNLGSHNLEISGDLAASGSGTVTSTAASSISFVTSSNISGTLMFTGSSSSGMHNLNVNVGSGNHVKIGGTATVAGTLTLTSGSLALADGSNITLTGDIANGGSGNISASPSSSITVSTANAPSGSLTFDANNNTLTNFTLNMSNGGSLTLASNLNVNGKLTLIKGNLYIGSQTLTMGSAGSVSGGSNSSYVITDAGGYVAMNLSAGTSAAMYPIGTSTYYYPATVTLNSGSASATISVNVTPHVYGHGIAPGTVVSSNQGVVDATWDFKSSNASNMNMNMMLMWNASAEVNSFDRSKAYIAHYTNNAWDVNATADASAQGNNMYAVSRNNITSFSPFAVFDQNTNAAVEPTAIVAGNFNIYPNPTTDNLYITNTSLSGKTVNVEITDISGKTVGTYKLNGSSTVVSLNGMKPGFYFVKLYDDQNTVTEKFIKD